MAFRWNFQYPMAGMAMRPANKKMDEKYPIPRVLAVMSPRAVPRAKVAQTAAQ